MEKFFRILIIIVLIISLNYGCGDNEVARPEKVRLELTVKPVSTYGGTDGSITAEFIGDERPYYFYWNTGDTTSTLNNLTVGKYTLKVVYGKGGFGIISKTVEVTQPQANKFKMDFTIVTPGKFGAEDGSIEIKVSGGYEPYTYKWSTGKTDSKVEKLEAGDYKVVVTDNIGIKDSAIVTVTQPAFIPGKDSIKDLDGIRYPTIVLGKQCWMAENLRTIHSDGYKRGMKEQEASKYIINGRFCNFDFEGDFCNGPKGSHYSWDAAMAGASEPDTGQVVQGICPSGWHIPSKADWDTLINYLSVEGNGGTGTKAGLKMRGAESISGFDALYAGNWGFQLFTDGKYAAFWTSNLNKDKSQALYYQVDEIYPRLTNNFTSKENGLSIRCVMNEKNADNR